MAKNGDAEAAVEVADNADRGVIVVSSDQKVPLLTKSRALRVGIRGQQNTHTRGCGSRMGEHYRASEGTQSVSASSLPDPVIASLQARATDDDAGPAWARRR